MEQERSTAPRKRYITSRQAGLGASLGGLAFVWRALGLAIPIVPPFVVDLCHTLVAIGAFAGGPYVALIISILIGIPTFTTVFEVGGYMIGNGLLICFLTKGIWKLRKRSKAISHGLIWTYAVVSSFLVAPAWWLSVLDAVFHMIPFKATYVYLLTLGLPDPISYTILKALPISILMEVTPHFMEPRWSWKGGEEVISEETGWTRVDTIGLMLFILFAVISILTIFWWFVTT